MQPLKVRGRGRGKRKERWRRTHAVVTWRVERAKAERAKAERAKAERAVVEVTLVEVAIKTKMVVVIDPISAEILRLLLRSIAMIVVTAARGVVLP